MVMNADSGCASADLTNNRYGCLCRRRAKYLIETTLEIPSVDDIDLNEIIENPEDTEHAGKGTGNLTFMGGGIDVMPGGEGYAAFKSTCLSMGLEDMQECMHEA